MRHFLIAAALFAGLATPANASDSQKPAAFDEPARDQKLAVGDLPPTLKATKWLQGEPVDNFEKGRVYVVEFWATWCGPCVAIMPHVADLQKEYRDKGVTVIGFSAVDPNNTADKVAGFIKKRGPKLGYTFAFADNRDTYDAYMKAAKQNGIPCSYVVGKDGKLAFIGHPAFLDYVLPRVLAGTWDPKEGAAEVARADADFDKAYAAIGGKDVEQGLKALSELEEKRPILAESVYFSVPRIALYIRAKKFEEARAAADKAITKACEQEDPLVLRQASLALRVPAAQSDKALLALAVKAVDAFVRIDGDQDPASLLIASEAHAAAGDEAQAKEYNRKALAAAEAAVAAEGAKPTSGTMFQLAQTYFATGDVAKAKEWGAKAVEAAPNQAQKDVYRREMQKYDGAEGKGGNK